MSCEHEEDLTAYLDSELSPTSRAALAAHLPGCADCQRTLALLQRSVETLATLPAFEPERLTGLATRRAVLARVDSLPLPWDVRLRRALHPRVLVPALGLAAAGMAVFAVTHHEPPRGDRELTPQNLALAMNLDVAESYEALQVDSVDDLDVVAHLDELEATP